ncbi:hypothetical protein G1H11_18215 [Phytoactinopolyspora alkaliphila]|uniref:Uncharacterized protein n=1 Tax=Phytoactinopolyspora alkaliphila TaxID=1783498 RepID=A0A6N9YQL1_9ACTN|nr:hypothetical protein [Phytoactinopolyspora alkaliphila]NED97237.1 hypothetical protein [Phytoactinopolyspora alkaliphila]
MADRAIAPTERVLVPSGRNYRMFVKSTPVLVGALGSMVVVRNGPASIIAAAVVALTLAGVAQFLRRERVVVTGTHVHSIRPVGLPKKRARADIATVLSVRLAASSGATPYRNLFVLDRRGRLVVRMRSPHWTPEDMRRLVAYLGLPAQELDRPVTARKLGSRFPRAISLSERYPFPSGVLVVLAMGAAILAVSALVD